MGPRRVGKTTALYQTVRHLIADGVPPSRIWWLRLDHPLLLQEDLGALVHHVLSQTDATPDRPAHLMLDELVYTDSWDLWLKTFFDDAWPVRVAATTKPVDSSSRSRSCQPTRWSGPSTKTSPSRSVSTAR